jgi:uncharacterized membrane protein YeaQ/YmgE (transglycosylase-associated protein family)
MAISDYLPIRDPEEDVIKSGATKITSLSAVVAGLAAIGVTFSDNLIEIFGETPPSAGNKTAILIALVGAWALIAIAVLFSRAIVTAASQPKLATAPAGMKVRRPDQEGSEAEKGWIVAAADFDPTKPEATRLLVLKSGQAPVWVAASTVKGE